MSTTQDAVRDEVRNAAKGKSQRVYGPSTGNVVIWYHDANKPSDPWFGKVVTAMALARTVITSTVTKLEPPPTTLAKSVLKRFFKLEDWTVDKKSEPFFEGIVDVFRAIQAGLSQQLVICLSQKNLGKNDRGYHGKQIHLSSQLAECHDLSVARTILHEAAHAFAKMPGTRTDEWTKDDELYAHCDDWAKAHPNKRRQTADAYAWAAISLHAGRILFPDDSFDETLGPF